MLEVSAPKRRPKYLNLRQIRLPLPGIVSILHRISGFGLFACMPLLLLLFDRSLGSPEAFAHYKLIVANPIIKLILFGLIWAYMHHMCAGIRFLLLDMHVGLELAKTRRNSKIVLAVSITLTLLLGVALW